MKIALLTSLSRWKNTRYSSGLLYIAGYLDKKGIENIIIEPPEITGKDYEKAFQIILKRLREYKPDLVCFTSNTPETKEVITLMNRIKKEKIDAFYAVGGPHASARPEDFINKGFDFAIVGEGEETIYGLIKTLTNKGDLNKVDGLAWKKNNKIIRNKPRKLIENLDDIFPAYHKIDMERYVKMSDDVVRGFPLRGATVLASRGCPYNCSFCACSYVFGRTLRFRSPESIEKEILILKNEYKVEGIWFLDDTLTISRKHVEHICKVMKKNNLLWGAQARVDSLDEEMIKLMKNSGCIQLDFGVESGSQRVLDDLIGKKTNLKQVEDVFRLCRKHRIRTLVSLIIGFPTETREEMYETFNLAKKIKADFFILSIAAPLPGTKLYDMVGVDLNVDTYHKVNLPGNEYTEIFNKSEVKDVKQLRDKFIKEFVKIATIRFLSQPFLIFKLWMKLPNKMQRLSYMLNTGKRVIKTRLKNSFLF